MYRETDRQSDTGRDRERYSEQESGDGKGGIERLGPSTMRAHLLRLVGPDGHHAAVFQPGAAVAPDLHTALSPSALQVR